MNYKLAKQLKDAGFPQGLIPGNWFYINKDLYFADKYWKTIAYKKEFTKIPLLSELIEACGMEFWILENLNNGMWVAKAIDREGKEILIKSKTPKEAAAKLYIKLNK